MTLIYARKFEDLIYVISDTAASTPILQTSDHPIYDPQLKIQPVSEDLSFAYAGSTYFVEQMPNFVGRSASSTEILEACIQTAQMSQGATEYLLIDRGTWQLFKIDEFGAHECATAMLGKQQGKERFQAARVARDTDGPTSIEMIGLPIDSTDSMANQNYGMDLSAFLDTLDYNDPDVRGVAIPFAVLRDSQRFMHYARVIRGPLTEGEISSEPTAVNFQDVNNGACTISLAGGPDWVAYHVLEAGFGIFMHVTAAGLKGTRFLNCSQQTFIEQGNRFVGSPFLAIAMS